MDIEKLLAENGYTENDRKWILNFLDFPIPDEFFDAVKSHKKAVDVIYEFRAMKMTEWADCSMEEIEEINAETVATAKKEIAMLKKYCDKDGKMPEFSIDSLARARKLTANLQK